MSERTKRPEFSRFDGMTDDELKERIDHAQGWFESCEDIGDVEEMESWAVERNTFIELAERRQQDAAREKRDAAAKALANRVHQMLDNLDDRLQLSPLECSYLQAALKAWEEANDGD